MDRISFIFSFFFLLSAISFGQETKVQSDEDAAANVVHLLSYVALDYGEAVEDGVIADEEEFEEQQEFVEKTIQLTEQSAFVFNEKKEQLLLHLNDLKQKIDAVASADLVAKLAKEIAREIILATKIPTAPKLWPSLSEGKALYAQHCATCHGNTGRGDGPAGVGLLPLPSSFFNAEMMDHFSVYQAFNTIRFGLDDTGMRPFYELSQEEIWALAFYVKSIRHEDPSLSKNQLKAHFEEISKEIDLADVAWLTDEELLAKIKDISPENALMKFKALRVLTPKNEAEEIVLEAIENKTKSLNWWLFLAVLPLLLGMYWFSKRTKKK
ncbi:MAG TPA: cytochrome c [Moheibacter sp.]|nr:cytochrome c [Moheibacter sp.]